MTDAELKGLGAQALNMAKRDIDRGEFNFLLASYYRCDVPPLHRMTTIEKLIAERLGQEWLNSGKAKDIGFNMLRLAVSLMPPDAVVIVTSANMFNPTPKLAGLPEAQQEELWNAPYARQHEAVKEGLLEICDAVYACVQTPTRVCEYIQAVGFDRPQTRYCQQAQFGGRMKMYP